MFGRKATGQTFVVCGECMWSYFLTDMNQEQLQTESTDLFYFIYYC